jgi:hypothetical protein
MTVRNAWLAGLLMAVLSAGIAPAQNKKKGEDNVRSVQGEISDAAGNPVAGAVVQLKDTKTLQIRSYITQEKGGYYFNGLNSNVDYELKAEFKGASSSTKTLSSFDGRKTPVINLKLDK